MKVYSALLSRPYAGAELLGVFGSRKDAVEFIKQQEGYQQGWYGSYGVVESELGQPVDGAVDGATKVEWVEWACSK